MSKTKSGVRISDYCALQIPCIAEVDVDTPAAAAEPTNTNVATPVGNGACISLPIHYLLVIFRKQACM